MDIDLDFQSTFNCQSIFPDAINASIVNRKNEMVKHPCGRYFQQMAVDPITNIAAIPYEEATILGYFKIDFLHLSAIDPIQSKQEIRDLSNKEPNWDLLNDEQVVKKLSHISKHYSLLLQTNPRSIDDLADVLSLIRPSKRWLLSDYLTNKEKTRKELYTKPPQGGMWFKRAHSIAYAITIVVQMHLIEQNRI